jgi:hypothetical protein
MNDVFSYFTNSIACMQPVHHNIFLLPHFRYTEMRQGVLIHFTYPEMNVLIS